jgi:hypothetical protein
MTFPTPTPSRSQDQDTFDAAIEAFFVYLPTFEATMNALAAAMSLNATTDTSASSNTIGTGAKTFTVTAGKSFVPGMWLVIADTAAPTTNAMFAQVTSYSGTTLVVNSYAVMGSGTKTAWVISQSAPAALDGLYATVAQIQGASLTSYTTGGTGTAFTLTPSPAISAYAANQTWNVIFNAACGAAPTLEISGIATPPNLVRQLLDGSYQNLADGDFPSGWQSTVKSVSASQVLVLRLPPRTKTGSFTRDMTAASGTQSITGVGFKPRVVRVYCLINGTLTGSIGELSPSGNVAKATSDTSSLNSIQANYLAYLRPASADYQVATGALTNDGFDLAWTKGGSPTGTGSGVYVAEE